MDDLISLLHVLLGVLGLLVPLLIGVAMLTYMERKIIAAMQLRRGPNVVGPFGLLQPFADGLKLLHKEIILPEKADRVLFFLAPAVTFTLALAAWAVIPLSARWVLADLNVGLLYLFAVSSLGVYGIIIGGWSSCSRYAFLGALRASAQMISYEVSIGLILVSVVILAGSLNLREIVLVQEQQGWFIIPLFPLFIIYLISALAETNRAPFDLPESETELVAGYNVEYSSMPFALFFLGEYANMILMAALATLLFLGGWLAPVEFLSFIPGPVWFLLKIFCVLFIFIWVRAALPRFRYDQLMRLGWKVFLPFSLVWVCVTAGWVLR